FWPHHHHYFFGDFYGSRYWGLGFRPWYSFGASHFDPLFSYYGWRNRGNPGWASGLHNSFQARSNGTVPLPVRSFSARSNVTSINNSTQIVNSLSGARNGNFNFNNVSGSQRAQHQAAAQGVQQLG